MALTHGAATELLEEFLSCIESTGGIKRDEDGHYVPVADPSWIDLGELYLEVCGAAGLPPKIAKEQIDYVPVVK